MELGGTTTGGEACSRDWIRGRYGEIQAAADGMLDLARRAGTGDEEAARSLPEQIRTFRAAYEAHMTFEEEMVAPRVEPVEPWGPERAARLLAQHDRVRVYLEQLRLVEGSRGDARLVGASAESAVSGIIAALEENMRDLLIAEVTNDEPVVPDQLTD